MTHTADIIARELIQYNRSGIVLGAKDLDAREKQLDADAPEQLFFGPYPLRDGCYRIFFLDGSDNVITLAVLEAAAAVGLGSQMVRDVTA